MLKLRSDIWALWTIYAAQTPKAHRSLPIFL